MLRSPLALLPASRLARAVPAVTVGVVIGVLEVVVASSFAALIFSGDLDRHLPAGIGLSLFAATAVLALVAALSSLPHALASVQDTTAAILALVAARIAATVPAEQTFLTVVLAIAVTSVAAGAFFFVLGALRLGNLVRFVPHPVVGGFLAGTGWLLAKGAVGVLTDVPVSMSTLSALVEPAAVAKWLPGLGFALLLLLLTRRSPHPLVIPGTVLVGVALFYAVALASGGGVEGVEEAGWLLGPFPQGGLWRPWSAEALVAADWGAVIAQGPGIATALVLGVLTLLLNISGIELATQRDVDLNRELRAAGVANLAAGIGGGIIGFHVLSLTALADRAGARTRLIGLTAAAVCGVALLFGGFVLSFFPKPVLGGLLLFLGLAFLLEWVYDARLRLPRMDYLLVLLILVVIAAFGFLQGVAVGLVVALTLFVMEYSRGDVVHRTLSGEAYRSKMERNPEHLAVLREEGERLHILELQGFVFFGTVNSLLERIRDRLDHPGRRSVSYLILDFRRVSGLDTSAVLGFVKAGKLAASRGIHLVLTGLSARARTQLQRGGFDDTPERGVSIFPDLDRGVQWCEDRLLEEAGVPPDAAPPPLGHQLRAALDDVDPDRLLPYLDSLEVPEGHTVMRQREPSEGLYFLESGRLRVQIDTEQGGQMRLRTVGPGTVVGEVALYLGTPRTASVIAETPSRMHRLSRDALHRMEREDPELALAVHRMFARLLAQRLADNLREIEALLG